MRERKQDLSGNLAWCGHDQNKEVHAVLSSHAGFPVTGTTPWHRTQGCHGHLHLHSQKKLSQLQPRPSISFLLLLINLYNVSHIAYWPEPVNSRRNLPMLPASEYVLPQIATWMRNGRSPWRFYRLKLRLSTIVGSTRKSLEKLCCCFTHTDIVERHHLAEYHVEWISNTLNSWKVWLEKIHAHGQENITFWTATR